MDIERDTLNFINMFKKDNPVTPINSEGRIIISGMGGSGISGMIVSNLYEVEGGKQVVSWNNYGLPNWINSKDYVICISYSGNTAETISAAEKAIEIGSAAAAIVVTKVGCAPAMPGLNEILEFMKINTIN